MNSVLAARYRSMSPLFRKSRNASEMLQTDKSTTLRWARVSDSDAMLYFASSETHLKTSSAFLRSFLMRLEECSLMNVTS